MPELHSGTQRAPHGRGEVFHTGALHLCRDPRDDFVLETVIPGEVDTLVSRDDLKCDLGLIEQLRLHGVEVLSVARFLVGLREFPG